MENNSFIGLKGSEQMRGTVTMKDLSTNDQKLVELIQDVYHGRIIGLNIINRGPSFDPYPQVIRYYKLGGDNKPRKIPVKRDFVLKQQVVNLLLRIKDLGDGRIICIEVQGGLPFLMSVEDQSHIRKHS